MELPSPLARYTVPDLPSAEELLPFLRRIDENRWYSNFGPLVAEFENRFAEAMAIAHGEPQNRRHCLTLSSGYHALAAGLSVLGIGPGSRVLVPAVTFPACPLAVLRVGAEPVLADIDSATWTLTPDIARTIAASNKIHAVMPVAVYGMPLPADEWDAFIRETGIPVLIDAAAAVESQRYLEHGLVAHSFHATKPFGIGEGGLLVSSKPEHIGAARRYTNFGSENRVTLQTGENAKMSEYHAAVALAQLKRWPAIKEKRKRIYEWYGETLKTSGAAVHLPHGLSQAVVSILMLQTKKPFARYLEERLQKENIAAHHIYLPPLYEHPHFSRLPLAGDNGTVMPPGGPAQNVKRMPHCDGMNQTAVGLPFHSFMSRKDVATVVKAVCRIVENGTK